MKKFLIGIVIALIAFFALWIDPQKTDSSTQKHENAFNFEISDFDSVQIIPNTIAAEDPFSLIIYSNDLGQAKFQKFTEEHLGQQVEISIHGTHLISTKMMTAIKSKQVPIPISQMVYDELKTQPWIRH